MLYFSFAFISAPASANNFTIGSCDANPATSNGVLPDSVDFIARQMTDSHLYIKLKTEH